MFRLPTTPLRTSADCVLGVKHMLRTYGHDNSVRLGIGGLKRKRANISFLLTFVFVAAFRDHMGIFS